MEILPASTPALFEAAVLRAAAHLRQGGVAVLPTETVYGLAANAFDPAAIALVYRIKGRPPHNPVIVHVSNLEMARDCAESWPPSASRLASAFWPGPLTLVLPRSNLIPDIVTAGGPTVAVRFPGHPIMRAVIDACGFPLAAPSANLSGQVSPTTCLHAAQALAGRVSVLVDGGPCQVGIESTVVDLSADSPRVLRPGMISAESIELILGRNPRGAPPPRSCVTPKPLGAATLRSPGLLEKHYAPRARVLVWTWKNQQGLEERLSGAGTVDGPVHVMAHASIPLQARLGVPFSVSIIPNDPEAFARALYSEMLSCDTRGVKTLIVEAVPSTPAWEGIADRLRRAASEFEKGSAES